MNPFTRNDSCGSFLSDQFRSTQVWDQLVYAFCLGIPVSRHRRRFRNFDDCFVAKSAVDWLHSYLKTSPYFPNKRNVSREQAIQLLRKFYVYDIITRVDGKENYDAEFEDNKDLYRLCSSALDKLPIVKPTSEQLNYTENQPSFNTTGLTEKSLALHNSLTNGPSRLASRNVAANSVKSGPRSIHRTYSNVSSLLSCQTVRTNGCVNRAFRDSTSNERTPFKTLQGGPVPSSNLGNLSSVTAKSYRPRTPTNVFWL